jgi:hypothetical protein
VEKSLEFLWSSPNFHDFIGPLGEYCSINIITETFSTLVCHCTFISPERGKIVKAVGDTIILFDRLCGKKKIVSGYIASEYGRSLFMYKL